MIVVWWLVAGVVLTIAEIFTLTLVLVMFAAGAFAAAGAAVVGAPIPVQGVVFALVSVLALAGVRPTVRRHRQRRGAAADSGVLGIDGGLARVVETVADDRGLVKIDGELWQARTAVPGQLIEAGEQVRITRVDGATVLVGRE